MRIVPYRVLFEPDLDPSLSGKIRYSVPSDELLPVPISKDGTYYQVQTHDRGDREEPARYYQVAFRIEDPSPYQLNELSLHLDSAIYRHSEQQIDNDLYCPPEIRNDTNRNLWYQRSSYSFDKKSGEWLITTTGKKALLVDCITTAGVFRVVVKRNGIVLPQYEQPWVYILPSSISKDDYIEMLSDLIRLNESLVRDEKHSTGIGTNTAIEHETNRIKSEINLTSTLIQAIQSIIRLPSELLGKRYTKKPIEKVHRFDGRVIRNYIQNGMTGKIHGIEYVEDHDTYENRIIKFVISRLLSSPLPTFHASDANIDVGTKTEEEFQRITAERQAKESTSEVLTQLSFRVTPPSLNAPSTNSYLSIVVKGNIVYMDGHNALKSKEKRYNQLVFYAKTRAELLFYLEQLAICYNDVSEHKVSLPEFCINCTKHLEISKWRNQISQFIISQCTKINGKLFVNPNSDISEQDYHARLCELTNRYDCIRVSNNSFFPSKPQITRPKIHQDYAEEQKMKADIRHEFEAKKAHAEACIQLVEMRKTLMRVMQEDWFRDVTLFREFQEVRPTAKFINNPYYSTVYQLIIQTLEMHPLLSASFDINAFGVNSTQNVYEYWVFCKLLFELASIGFIIEGSERKNLLQLFSDFVSNNQSARKHSGFSINAVHKSSVRPIEITIGYDNKFDSHVDYITNKQPDFYICVKRPYALHWYFMDAKYKTFSRCSSRNAVSYLQEIYDVAIAKYIVDMQTILDSHPDYSRFDNEIRGSYIAMANTEDGEIELAENERLFGGNASIFSDESVNHWCDSAIQQVVDNSKYSLPGHRYGAIMLTPTHDEELRSLLRLIFEYLESDKSDSSDRNPNLLQCWRCGSKDVERKPVSISRNDYQNDEESQNSNSVKYWITCHSCQAFRVDNHCVSCGCLIVKHTSGNYHRWDDTVTSTRWAFICPQCGAGVKARWQNDIMNTVLSTEDYQYDELPF